MKRFVPSLVVTLVAVCAMGLMATSAFALPDVSLTLCTGSCVYPLHLHYSSNTVKTTFENVNGVVFAGEGLVVSSTAGSLTALGTFTAVFLKVAKGTEKCFNQGTEANGEVAIEGGASAVYTSLAGSSQGLQIGELFLLKELTGATEVVCPTNANKIKVKGSVLTSVNTGAGSGSTTQLTGGRTRVRGRGGKQEFRAFYNDAGTGVLAKLESNVDGAGFKETNNEVEGEPEETALEGKMFVVSGR